MEKYQEVAPVVDSKMPKMCCHGYMRPKTSMGPPRYITSSDSHDEIRKSAMSVGLQTETPKPRLFSRSKSTMNLSQENDFYQRYCDSRRRQQSVIRREMSADQIKNMLVSSPLKQVPIYRTGKMGACWRHLKRVTGPCGENIMFIDGTVKESDCYNYPPHGFPTVRLSPQLFLNNEELRNYISRPKSTIQSRINENIRRAEPTETNHSYRESEFRNTNFRSPSSDASVSRNHDYRRAVPT